MKKKIKELGGKPAFPLNISVNEIAAHYTPDVNDSLVFKTDDLVKVDIGVHVNGYISDVAFTVCVGHKSHPLIETAEKALKEAVKLIKAGTKVREISEVVDETITNAGFEPVRNLSGHGLEQYVEHANPTIPNGKNSIETELKEGQAIAMEVFTTDGSGWVKDSRPILIYQFFQDKPVRLWEARKILEMSQTEFGKLPFCKRWITGVSPIKMEMAVNQLLELEALQAHPILKEENDGLVAQAEETIIVK